MNRKEQNKILNAKIEYNIIQYKVDKLNAEISAFSSGNLNKYEFLTRKNLNYKPNALKQAKFEFSPLGKTISTGLNKTIPNFQEEEVVIKLLKDIRNSLSSRINIPSKSPPKSPPKSPSKSPPKSPPKSRKDTKSSFDDINKIK